ncbi:MAG: cation diffusion facilitator family transporter [Clostridiaceae bacterium]
MKTKSNWAKLSIISNAFLILLKVVVGVLSGSVSIISEGIHSTMDLFAAIVAFISIKISARPADEDHQYGHEKVENISGVIESLLIFAASFFILYEAIKKIVHPEPIDNAYLGVIVMGVSAGVNFLVSKKLYKVAKEEGSIALEADALHLKADVLTSLGVAIGLLIIQITNLYILDSIVAITVAIFILKEAYELLAKAFNPLIDISLTKKEINIINSEIEKYNDQICKCENLRTRNGGNTKYIDFNITTHENLTVREAHDICDKIEDGISQSIKNTSIMIHIESCKNSCEVCRLNRNSCNCKQK